MSKRIWHWRRVVIGVPGAIVLGIWGVLTNVPFALIVSAMAFKAAMVKHTSSWFPLLTAQRLSAWLRSYDRPRQ